MHFEHSLVLSWSYLYQNHKWNEWTQLWLSSPRHLNELWPFLIVYFTFWFWLKFSDLQLSLSSGSLNLRRYEICKLWFNLFLFIFNKGEQKRSRIKKMQLTNNFSRLIPEGAVKSPVTTKHKGCTKCFRPGHQKINFC